MLLSIVLMIKNEEKHLEKTLKALEILRKNVNSELIILDTGSTDRSIEIASKYTDKIYFEKWNDDFGQMRNKSISYAKGEWILVLDADEELVNCDKMIKFFNTPLHKEYNSASIELKNINSEDNKLYTKSINIRVFKNTGFRYEGIIHEQPMYKEPTYNNIAIFNHYGYLYTDEEQKKYKLQRNEKLLLKVLKKKPIDSYANFQMAKNLMAMDENEEAIYYMEKSFEICKKNGNIPAYVQSNLAKLYLILEKYTKCENICIDYIEKDTKNIDIYYYLALSQSMNNKYNDSLINYKRYIYLLENYEISTQYNDILCDGNTIGLRDQAEVYIVKIYYLLEEYNKVYDTISKLKMEQIRSIYSIIFMSIIKVNKIESILNLYENLNSNVEKNEFKLELEKVLLKTSESNRKLYHILKEIEGNYGTLNKVRSGKFINLDEYRRMLTEENDDYYSILIDYAFKEGFEIEDILKGIDKTHIQDYFDYMIEYRNGNTIDLYEYLLT
ncbi:glycosyltransferase, partial [Terrisporobacter glycolicus]|uniref:glycosyltransferase n=1 Tax=Terrisporobacter glycolicus TaxID=36841 RepID=UPI0034643BFA